MDLRNQAIKVMMQEEEGGVGEAHSLQPRLSSVTVYHILAESTSLYIP